jgi:hypothetical protein
MFTSVFAQTRLSKRTTERSRFFVRKPILPNVLCYTTLIGFRLNLEDRRLIVILVYSGSASIEPLEIEILQYMQVIVQFHVPAAIIRNENVS